MAIITKIEQQKKRQNRYSVFVDEQYSFSVSANDLLASGLHTGQSLTDSEIKELETASAESKVHEQALNYLSYRRRTAKEMSDHLVGKGHDKITVDEVVQDLITKGLLNESEFASAWIRDRQTLKPRSKRRLSQELRQKGLSSDVVESALGAISEEEERAALYVIASKKLALARYRETNKLTSYLVSQGFDYSLVKSVLTEFNELSS